MATTKTKVNPATPESAYSETVKAVQLIERIEQEKRKEIPYADRLQMVKKALEAAQTRQDAEELEKEKRELELALKFPQRETLNFPEDKRDIVRENYRIESEQADALLTDLYAQLEKAADALAAAVPVLKELKQVESKKAVAALVEPILNDQIQVHPGSTVQGMPMRYLKGNDPAQTFEALTRQTEKHSAQLKALAENKKRNLTN